MFINKLHTHKRTNSIANHQLQRAYAYTFGHVCGILAQCLVLSGSRPPQSFQADCLSMQISWFSTRSVQGVRTAQHTPITHYTHNTVYPFVTVKDVLTTGGEGNNKTLFPKSSVVNTSLPASPWGYFLSFWSLVIFRLLVVSAAHSRFWVHSLLHDCSLVLSSNVIGWLIILLPKAAGRIPITLSRYASAFVATPIGQQVWQHNRNRTATAHAATH